MENNSSNYNSNATKMNITADFHVSHDTATRPSPSKHSSTKAQNYQSVDFDNDPELNAEYELFVKLEDATQLVHIKTFLALRSILRPHPSLLLCCQALVKLFAGLDENIPAAYADSRKIEWDEIKILFNQPIRFINLISFFKEFAVRGEIPMKNVISAEHTLELISATKEPIHEAYSQIMEFLCSAIDFYKFLIAHSNPKRSSVTTSAQKEEVRRASMTSS